MARRRVTDEDRIEARRLLLTWLAGDNDDIHELDLLDEVAYWNDDYWRYALLAAVALIRASAAKAGCSVGQLCHQLATLNGLSLDAPAGDGAAAG